jgi:hypothetical protein
LWAGLRRHLRVPFRGKSIIVPLFADEAAIAMRGADVLVTQKFPMWSRIRRSMATRR